MSQVRILIVDDEDLLRLTLRNRLVKEGFLISEAADLAQAKEKLGDEPHLLLLDQRLPDGTGLDFLRELRRQSDVPVVMITAHGSLPQAVEAMRAGAFDYIAKPFDLDEVVLTARRALESAEMRRELTRLRKETRESMSADRILGKSQKTLELREIIKRVARSPASTILVTGESGTGKGLVARAIHGESENADRPFVNITCTALPESLMESELFGHERGAFTDARVRKQGLLEMADGGTVFLDEIGDLPMTLQGKLLRFLEEKTFRRVGGVRDISVDVRIVAATNKNMDEVVREGSFRADLYYRLKVIPVHVPPLRERREDVPVLANAFLQEFASDFKKRSLRFSAGALDALQAYDWPGNVRELRNAVERAVLLGRGEELTENDLAFEVLGMPPTAPAMTGAPSQAGAAPAGAPGGHAWVLPPSGIILEDLERDLLVQALERTGHNQTRAGKLLGINRDQVRYRLEKFGLRKSS